MLYSKKYLGPCDCGNRKYSAARRTWEKAFGPVPKGLHVLHKCDNPPCSALSHLFLGTREDNMQDMVAKGRGTVGTHLSEEHKAKISVAQKGKPKPGTSAALTGRHRPDISAANLGHSVSEDVRRRIGLAHKGKNVSVETRRKQSLAAKKRRPKRSPDRRFAKGKAFLPPKGKYVQ